MLCYYLSQSPFFCSCRLPTTLPGSLRGVMWGISIFGAGSSPMAGRRGLCQPATTARASPASRETLFTRIYTRVSRRFSPRQRPKARSITCFSAFVIRPVNARSVSFWRTPSERDIMSSAGNRQRQVARTAGPNASRSWLLSRLTDTWPKWNSVSRV